MSEVSIAAEEPLALSMLDVEQLQKEYLRLKQQTQVLERSVRKSEERRRALMHILSDLNAMNRKLNDQRKAMIHILADYEQDRRRLEKQTERLDNSRRALMHILQDSYKANQRLENSRKAMIHIMSDLRETTEEVKRREHELRDKQEQLVQAGKLATLGELTTGIAHELNNPLNNIGLFVGNAIDLIAFGTAETSSEQIQQELGRAMQQVRKATEIITHLRTFGRAASVSYEPVILSRVIASAISLVQEQLRLRQIEIQTFLPGEEMIVTGNAIQLEQVFLNLLTNARDAVTDMAERRIAISCTLQADIVEIRVRDTGPGIAPEFEQRIFDPFFTTKEVGAGTGLGLSITYSIIQEHHGTISLANHPGQGALFLIQLPRLRESQERDISNG
jgi:C4-dicarboxylate-specific signal transduction histidine kinase